MAEVVGIRFKRAGRVYYFDPADNELQANDQVVVKTARGLELACVSCNRRKAGKTTLVVGALPFSLVPRIGLISVSWLRS